MLIAPRSASAAATVPLTGPGVRLDVPTTATMMLDDGAGGPVTLALRGTMLVERGAGSIVEGRVTADANPRIALTTSGSQGQVGFGPGTAAVDWRMRRTGTSIVTIDNNSGAAARLDMAAGSVLNLDTSGTPGEAVYAIARHATSLRAYSGTSAAPSSTVGPAVKAVRMWDLKVRKGGTVATSAGSAAIGPVVWDSGTPRGFTAQDVGRPITHPNFPAGSAIASFVDKFNATASANATASGAGQLIIGTTVTDAIHQFEFEGTAAVSGVVQDAGNNQAQLHGVMGMGIASKPTSWDVLGGLFRGEGRPGHSRLAAGIYVEARQASSEGHLNTAEFRASNGSGKVPIWLPDDFDGPLLMWLSADSGDCHGIHFVGLNPAGFRTGIGFKRAAYSRSGLFVGLRFASTNLATSTQGAQGKAQAIIQVDAGDGAADGSRQQWDYGIDLGASGGTAGTTERIRYTNLAIRLPRGAAVGFRNEANSGDLPVLGMRDSNVLSVGGTQTTPAGVPGIMFHESGALSGGATPGLDGFGSGGFVFRTNRPMGAGVGAWIGLSGADGGTLANFAAVQGQKTNGTSQNSDGDCVIWTASESAGALREALRLKSNRQLQVPVLPGDPSDTPPAGYVYLYATGADLLKTKDSAGTVRSVNLS